MSNNKETFPMTHDQIGELVANEREAPNGGDEGFHLLAADIIEQLLMELTEATSEALTITDESTPFSDKERETVLQDSNYLLGPYASHHKNWIRRMDATVRQREEVIAQLKQPCPDCDDGNDKISVWLRASKRCCRRS